VEAYEKAGARFIVSARKTSRLVDELKAAQWTGSPKTDADGQCEFRYQPEGWSKAHRFIALRYVKIAPRPRPAVLQKNFAAAGQRQDSGSRGAIIWNQGEQPEGMRQAGSERPAGYSFWACWRPELVESETWE